MKRPYRGHLISGGTPGRVADRSENVQLTYCVRFISLQQLDHPATKPHGHVRSKASAIEC